MWGNYLDKLSLVVNILITSNFLSFLKLKYFLLFLAILSRSHFLFLHMEKAATLVNFNTKPVVETRPTRISDRNPHVQVSNSVIIES